MHDLLPSLLEGLGKDEAASKCWKEGQELNLQCSGSPTAPIFLIQSPKPEENPAAYMSGRTGKALLVSRAQISPWLTYTRTHEKCIALNVFWICNEENSLHKREE